MSDEGVVIAGHVVLPRVGARIRLIDMPDDPDPIPRGSTGTIVGATPIGDWTQVEVNWDNGRKLSMSVPPDSYEHVS